MTNYLCPLKQSEFTALDKETAVVKYYPKLVLVLLPSESNNEAIKEAKKELKKHELSGTIQVVDLVVDSIARKTLKEGKQALICEVNGDKFQLASEGFIKTHGR